jgi:hypothetical protein
MNLVFTNSREDDVIYPLTVPEIADAQKDCNTLTKYIRKRIIPLN